jgi:hypothetical protein
MISSTLHVLTKRIVHYVGGLSLLTSAFLYGDTSSPCIRSSRKSDLEQSQATKSSSKCHYKNRFQGSTTFIPRSQGDNTARELAGWQQKLFLCYDANYAAIASTIAYTRSLETDCIANRLFSSTRLTFSGSQFNSLCQPSEGTLNKRKSQDIVADYFGLPTNFTGTLSIKPHIENAIIDINLYFGLADSLPGLFLWINAPIVHTRWTLGLNDSISCQPKFSGCTTFPDCYMFSGDTTPNQNRLCPTPQPARRTPPSEFSSSESSPQNPDQCPINSHLDLPRRLRNSNCTTQSLREALSGKFTFGDMTEEWEFGRFSFCPRSKTGLADIDVMMGWNFIQNDYVHLGFFGVTVIPTGNRPKARYIFEPLIGDGKHWKLGGGASAHLSFFPNIDETYFNMGIYMYGKALQVFETDQIRSFDFIGNEHEPTHLLTRYMLLKEFNSAKEYNGTMINAINFATRNCEVKVGLIADVSVKAFIAVNGWEFDLGYNFYYREGEKISLKTEGSSTIDSRIFGFKGLEGVCCTSFDVRNINNVDTLVVPPIKNSPLNSTQPQATMFNPELPQKDPFIVEPESTTCLSWNSELPNENTPFQNLTPKNCFIGIEQSGGTFVTCANLDLHSAEQKEMRTNKVFAHLNYTFDSCYSPFVGIGAEGELDACNNNALQQWGIWIKAGASF